MSALARAQAPKVPELCQHYACIMTRWHQNASQVAGLLWGESTDDGWFPIMGPMMLNFDISCAVNRNRLLSKQSYCRWSETPQLMRRHRIGRSPTNKQAIPSAHPELICNVTYGLCRILLFIKSVVFISGDQTSLFTISDKFARLRASCVLGYM